MFFWVTGLVFCIIVSIFVLYLLHDWLYYKSFVYSEVVEFICLPYLIWFVATLPEKKLKFLLESTKNNKRPSVKVIKWIIKKIR